MSKTIHTFETTREAYDASQTHDSIRDGDVLAVPAEGVFGFLAGAWPVAVTEAIGCFHAIAGVNLEQFQGGEYAESIEKARELAEPPVKAAPVEISLELGGLEGEREIYAPDLETILEVAAEALGSPGVAVGVRVAGDHVYRRDLAKAAGELADAVRAASVRVEKGDELPQCPLCHGRIVEHESRCEFVEIPGVLLHADCVEEHGADAAREAARGVKAEVTS